MEKFSVDKWVNKAIESDDGRKVMKLWFKSNGFETPLALSKLDRADIPSTIDGVEIKLGWLSALEASVELLMKPNGN